MWFPIWLSSKSNELLRLQTLIRELSKGLGLKLHQFLKTCLNSWAQYETRLVTRKLRFFIAFWCLFTSVRKSCFPLFLSASSANVCYWGNGVYREPETLNSLCDRKFDQLDQSVAILVGRVFRGKRYFSVKFWPLIVCLPLVVDTLVSWFTVRQNGLTFCHIYLDWILGTDLPPSCTNIVNWRTTKLSRRYVKP